ncbi:hypothetical protein [Aneurinibacillus sp. REN35]|uniref:hypothetical protein n=1 Tax=Aneurinibacillus sp. REN35 TaxID=3237286 RepID=UPI0035299037
MKRVKLMIITFVWMLTTTSVSANGVDALGAGSWDYVGSDVFTKESRVFKSGGGDFKICISKDSRPGTYWLNEDDPIEDDWVLPPLQYYGGGFPNGDFDSKGCYVYRDIGGFVDGRDNQAEFKLTKDTRGNSTVRAWD